MIEKLIERVKTCKTKSEKQVLAAEIISALPQFLKDLGEKEQKYNTLLRKCVESEGSRTAGLLILEEHDIHKEFKYIKRLYEIAEKSISVLNMYTEK